MKNIILLLVTLFFLNTFSFAQIGEFEGDIRISDATPRIELFDNALSENRIEGTLQENANNILLSSFRGDIRFLTESDGTSPSIRMTIDGASGNVGIGTSNPEAKLSILSGTAQQNFTGSSIVFKGNNFADASIAHALGVTFISNNVLPTTNTIPKLLVTNKLNGDISRTNISIDSKGEVGIGYHFSSHPSAAVHLMHRPWDGDNSSGIRMQNGANGNNWTFFVRESNNDLQMYNSDNANDVMGTFDAETGAYSPASDARLKEDIMTLRPVLDKIIEMRPVNYYFKKQTDRSKKPIGFIAQEVNELFPEFVKYNDEIDQYNLDYAGMVTVTIKAIQEQQEIINRLITQNDDLNKRLSNLEE